MVARNSWIRFPHTFVVYKQSTPDTYPPTQQTTQVLSGSCNVQTNASGNIKNENEAMVYDFVLFHKEILTETIKPGYKIICNITDGTIIGEVKKIFSGQLTKRIWFNEISN